MSRTDALAFLSRLESDAALRQAAAKAAAGHFAENLIALGAKQGLSFDENDLQSALASKQSSAGSAQLSDEDLENAAGGSSKEQKTAQMFDMLRVIIERYNAAAKSVIQNIR